MRRINISDAETAITITTSSGDVTYENVTINRIEPNDPRTRKLILDKQGKTDGYHVGLNSDQPLTLNVQLKLISSELNDALDTAFESGDRIAINVADTKSLAQISLRKGIISTPTKNRVIEEGETLYDTTLIIETAHKNYEDNA